jgi:hypothetical protein
MGYTQYYEKQDRLAEIMKFGKRVFSDNKLTSEELLKNHLQQMRSNLEKARTQKEQKRLEEL